MIKNFDEIYIECNKDGAAARVVIMNFNLWRVHYGRKIG